MYPLYILNLHVRKIKSHVYYGYVGSTAQLVALTTAWRELQNYVACLAFVA